VVVYDCRDADNQAAVAWSHALAFALSWIALLSVSGCVIAPVRVPTQTRTTTENRKSSISHF